MTGVIYADIDDNLYKVNASKGVILATGDYGGNQQMIQYYMPRVLEDGEWLGWPDTDARVMSPTSARACRWPIGSGRVPIIATHSPTTITADPSAAIRCSSWTAPVSAS